MGYLIMARVCELTGKRVMTGNNVSHAKNRTKRRYLPNLCRASLLSDELGQTFRLRVSAAALRSVDHRGGLDHFLLKATDSTLSPRALKIKRSLLSARKSNQEAAAADSQS